MVEKRTNGRDRSNNSDRAPLLDRRSYLQWAGTAAGAALATTAAAAAGDAGTSSTEVVDTSEMSERRLSISDGDDLSQYVANSRSGQLLVVPQGTYEWNGTPSFSRRNWGIRADGPVTVMVPENRGTSSKNDYILNIGGDNILLEGLTFDSTGQPGTGIRCVVDRRAEIRNITVENDGPRSWNSSQTNLFNVGADSSNGHVLLDGIVAQNNGNIAQYNGGQSRIGVWCSRSGKLEIKNSLLAGFPNNGVYTRMPGEMEIDNCVFANNNVAGVRLGGRNEVVKNSTFYLDLSLDGADASSRGNANTGGITADSRARAANGGYVRNCSFIVKDTPNSTGAIRFLDNEWIDVEDCQFLLDQSDVPGVGWNNSGSVRLRNLTFDTENSSNAVVAGSGGRYSTVENVCVSSDLRSGQISANSGTCRFDWDRAHEYPDPSFVDKPETPDESGGQEGNEDGQETDSDEPELARTIEIDGNGNADRSEYRFVVDGELEASEELSRYGTGGEFRADGVVAGFVRGGIDGFRFSGELTELEIDGEAVVRLDGEEIDEKAVGSDDEEPDDGEADNDEGNDTHEHTIAIDGNGSGERSEYRFIVNGEIERSEELSEYGTGGEFRDDGVVAGFVRGGVDGFRFFGELTELGIDGSATVRLDGEVIDPDEIGIDDSDADEPADDENSGEDAEPDAPSNSESEDETGGSSVKSTLVIDGNSSPDRSEYRFVVDGNVGRSERLSEYGTGGEFRDDGSVDGFVRGGRDGFRFSGQLVDFEIDGDATIRVNGVEIDPAWFR